jgi:dUTP pyrophosphatase
MKHKIKRFDKNIPLPKYEKMAAGFDFYLPKSVIFGPGETKTINTNIAMEIPEGYFFLIAPRSTTFSRFGLIMPHSMGIIDPMYRGDDNELVLLFHNLSKKKVTVPKSAKIAQGILIKYEKAEFQEVNKLNKSKRGRWNIKVKNKYRMGKRK